jgi:hypothetical protein
MKKTTGAANPDNLVFCYSLDGRISAKFDIDECGILDIDRADATLRKHGLKRVSPWTVSGDQWVTDVEPVT